MWRRGQEIKCCKGVLVSRELLFAALNRITVLAPGTFSVMSCLLKFGLQVQRRTNTECACTISGNRVTSSGLVTWVDGLVYAIRPMNIFRVVAVESRGT